MIRKIGTVLAAGALLAGCSGSPEVPEKHTGPYAEALGEAWGLGKAIDGLPEACASAVSLELTTDPFGDRLTSVAQGNACEGVSNADFANVVLAVGRAEEAMQDYTNEAWGDSNFRGDLGVDPSSYAGWLTETLAAVRIASSMPDSCANAIKSELRDEPLGDTLQEVGTNTCATANSTDFSRLLEHIDASIQQIGNHNESQSGSNNNRILIGLGIVGVALVAVMATVPEIR
jgi:hypothetical protein